MSNEIYQQFINIIKNDYDSFYNKDPNKKKVDEIKQLLYNFVYWSPSKNGSEGAKKFSDYEFDKDKGRYKKVINKIKEQMIYKFKKNENIIKSDLDDFHNAIKLGNNYICFKTNNVGQLDSFYNRLRNSFAHTNFYINKNLYIGWNEDSNKKLKALYVLSYDTFKFLSNVYIPPID